MKTKDRTTLSRFMLVVLILLTASGCGQIAGDANYTLGEGESVSGTLFLFSNNAILEKDATVDGSVIMVCCNLTVNGDINGDIFMVTGNLRIAAYADVSGDIRVISGNVSR